MIFVLKTMLYVGIVVYAPTIALSSVTNLSWWVCVLLLGICATIYTTLGGIQAIVWTDVFQIFIMFGGILAIFIEGLNETGSKAKELSSSIGVSIPMKDTPLSTSFLSPLFCGE